MALVLKLWDIQALAAGFDVINLKKKPENLCCKFQQLIEV
jgi:hypothetical protein